MTGNRFLDVASRRVFGTLAAVLAVAFMSLTPGTAHANDWERQITHLRVTIGTGDDDLRKASQAVAKLAYRTVTGDTKYTSGNLNNGANWPNWSTRTVTIPMPVGILLGNLVEFSIEFTSGQPDIFSTGDEWKMNSIMVTAILDDGSEAILVNAAGNPLHHFKHDRNTRWQEWL